MEITLGGPLLWGEEGQRDLFRGAELLRGRAGLRSRPLILETGFLPTDAVWTPSFFLGVGVAVPPGYFLLRAWLFVWYGQEAIGK